MQAMTVVPGRAGFSRCAAGAALLGAALGVGLLPSIARAQTARKVIVDQDCRGPATTDLISVLMMLQAPDVEVLGITVVSGDQWRDEEVAHTLRLLELVGREDVPVVPGAVYPLINRKEDIARWERLHGRVGYKGAWNDEPLGSAFGWWAQRGYYPPDYVPPLPEGMPTLKPADEHAAQFLVRMVRQFPDEVTIYAGGPLTNLALALAIDPEFPARARELVLMGSSINPQVPEDAPIRNAMMHTPRREFNFWWDPEATRMVLRGSWKKVTVTTVDVSVKTRFSAELKTRIARSQTRAAQYLDAWADEQLMWDEVAVAAWLDPSIITREESMYMDIDIDHGAGYGNTLTWPEGAQPRLGERLVHAQFDLDLPRFYALFTELMTAR